jgi:hypothetical protein
MRRLVLFAMPPFQGSARLFRPWRIRSSPFNLTLGNLATQTPRVARMPNLKLIAQHSLAILPGADVRNK